MQILGSGRLGNKAENLNLINSLGLPIPNTIVVEACSLGYFDLRILDPKLKYILRPSFLVEDGKEKSYAGFFKSLYPLELADINNFLSQKNDLPEIFGGKGLILSSIIIQEFIETDVYGVYFSKNPNNILVRGFYELSDKNDGVTSGVGKTGEKLSIGLDFKLRQIGSRLEKKFGHPQDIEFCVQNDNIIILQTRNITTGNDTIYDFHDLQKMNGIYHNIDNGEFSEANVLIVSILGKFMRLLIIGKRVYAKSGISIIIKNDIPELIPFISAYRKYLIVKWALDFLYKIMFFQKTNNKVLFDLYRDYGYYFNIYMKSNFNAKFDIKANFKTKILLKQEKSKTQAFLELEKLKATIIKKGETINGDLNYLKIDELYDSSINHEELINKRKHSDSNLILGDRLVIIKGTLIKGSLDVKNDFDWIYKGSLNGILTDINGLGNRDQEKYILLIDNLNINLFEILEHISGVIIKEGFLLSHNTIILRESKIPSIINYKKYEDLNIGESFIL